MIRLLGIYHPTMIHKPPFCLMQKTQRLWHEVLAMVLLLMTLGYQTHKLWNHFHQSRLTGTCAKQSLAARKPRMQCKIVSLSFGSCLDTNQGTSPRHLCKRRWISWKSAWGRKDGSFGPQWITHSRRSGSEQKHSARFQKAIVGSLPFWDVCRERRSRGPSWGAGKMRISIYAVIMRCVQKSLHRRYSTIFVQLKLQRICGKEWCLAGHVDLGWLRHSFIYICIYVWTMF